MHYLNLRALSILGLRLIFSMFADTVRVTNVCIIIIITITITITITTTTTTTTTTIIIIIIIIINIVYLILTVIS